MVSIGTDPEVFLDRGGFRISAHDLIPGTKEMPHPVTHGAIQVDGVAAEFNTLPAKTPEEFLEFIESVMSDLRKELPSDVQIVIEPTCDFDVKYFEELPEIVKLLGCTPDFDAYTGERNSPPFTEVTFRTGAGHIHVGGWAEAYDPEEDSHFRSCVGMVKQLDCVLFPTSLLWDYDQKRRELYGRIGAFRPKFYGVEYRSLSNAYLKTQAIQRWVFEASKFSSERFLEGEKFFEYKDCRELTESIYHGEVPTQSEVRSYLRTLHEKFGTPLFL